VPGLNPPIGRAEAQPMMQSLQQKLRYSPVRPVYDRLNLLRWKARGRPIPPPYALKRRTVWEYAQRYGISVLVETGTFQGDMMYFAKSRFAKAYSIELDPGLYRANRERFSGSPSIELIEGDSGVELPKLVTRLTQPTLFWLDGHYSGPGTACGVQEAPIAQEMACIFDHPIRDHVILIDDAREFTGRAGYPTIPELQGWVKQQRPEFGFEVLYDIIRITPPAR
jgi:hypothetical protein